MPAAKIIIAAIITMQAAVPRSGSASTSATTPPSTTPIGSSEYPTSSIRSIRRSSSAAMNRITAILASSDGWMPSGPSPIQRVAPLTRGANSTATSANPTIPSAVQITAGCR